jgi:CheY-like chemotaxis protein
VPTVLLIDDNALQLCMRATVLRDAGFLVLTASTAEQAFAALRPSSPVNAIVTDHLMPGVRGPELVHTVRALHPHVPVIAISGLPGAESEYAGLNVIFLRKPCRPEELIQRLRRCLSIRATLPTPS